MKKIDSKALKNWNSFIERETDVPAEMPSIKIPLNWVGVTNISIPLKINSLEYPLKAFVDAGCNLKKNQRGVHTSRSIEEIFENVDTSYSHIIDFVKIIVERNKVRQHANNSYVEIRAHGFMKIKEKNISKSSIEPIELFAQAGLRNSSWSCFHGVKLQIIDACPCTSKFTKYLYGKKFVKKYGLEIGNEFIEKVNTATHTQRGQLKVSIEDTNGKIDSIELVHLLRKNVSSSIELLKRKDEHIIVDNVTSNPKFSEDIVRETCRIIYPYLLKLEEKSRFTISMILEESLHHHNVLAKISSDIKNIRRYLK